MSDESNLLNMLASFDLQPQVDVTDKDTSVTLVAKEGGVQGYGGFVCEFKFDKDGKFIEVGIWE